MSTKQSKAAETSAAITESTAAPAPAVVEEPSKGGSYVRDPATGALSPAVPADTPKTEAQE